ncbi:putative N,O-diacetyl muramidase [Lindgomyces ingoldianus]|uniref:N,O-diacetyl muramidase n=1 Tax=Lindgomyces ingoldianus TaxID=673940 RepID=A0ACB6QH71_9PLEO|nr:putative N,O-diacetyl muramidase [Lindgomyces ingoldianus]KAF2466226.1 putative N,O-diacetyl muramidase [Lindgomyces ingoldianus]
MKYLVALLALATNFCHAAVPGFDISHYQGTVDFKSAYSSGARFVIIKATEGTTYQDPNFSKNYNGATSAGLIRGAYHFAQPASSSGSAQAQYFVAHGGGWSGDGITLPGMLDIEYGATSTCYGLGTSAMVSWITSFVNEYHALTSRWPMIYTTNDWWVTCTGNSKAFSGNSPLVLARYSSSVGTIPGGWPYQTIWQFNDAYTYGGDSDSFNGAFSSLQKLATG